MRTREETEKMFRLWREKIGEDPVLGKELLSMEGEPERIKEAFGTDLGFGTGGLRGRMGAGTARMNRVTVERVVRGVIRVLSCHSFPGGKEKDAAERGKQRRIAIGYDSRHNSKAFAELAAKLCTEAGMEVYLWPELIPVPCLSFSVRYLHCDAGFMVTSSHNPGVYNGLKVYGPDGCHIGNEAAGEVFREMQKLPWFPAESGGALKEGTEEKGKPMPAEVYEAFLQTVKRQSVLRPGDQADRDLPIVYSPLNGTGRRPVTEILKRCGFTNLHLVKEQEEPDGDFPTCPSPNPELPAAMELGICRAEETGADLFLATDPDCDRVGAAVRTGEGSFRLLSGNEMGVLLLDFLCERRREAGTMPKSPVLIKSIVSTDMAEQVASAYGVRTINVLTGFKYVGEQMDLLEEQGREEDFLFSFEESCGCLTGTYSRDKDGVAAVLLICEMAAFYHARGKSLDRRMKELYETYGYRKETQYSFPFEGAEGQQEMEKVMERLRRREEKEERWPDAEEILDYAQGLFGLPPANVLKIHFRDRSTLMLRPSGTEPKLKLYLSACGASEAAAKQREKELAERGRKAVAEENRSGGL